MFLHLVLQRIGDVLESGLAIQGPRSSAPGPEDKLK